VALTGKVVNIPNVYEAEGFDFTGPRKYDAATGYRTESMLVIPMQNHEIDEPAFDLEKKDENEHSLVHRLLAPLKRKTPGRLLCLTSGYLKYIFSNLANHI
jgi:hypothetical protein